MDDFDLEAMVSLKGETDPGSIRLMPGIQSISRKVDFKPEIGDNYSLKYYRKLEIIKPIQDFPRIINCAADNLRTFYHWALNLQLAWLKPFNKYSCTHCILDESPERDSPSP